jgi:hypothetical protein
MNPYLSNYFSPQKEKPEQRRSVNYNDNQNALMRKKRTSVREIGELPPVVHPRRREKCRKNLKLFLKTYLPDIFDRPWSPDHLKVLEKVERALYHGNLYAFAMPRGSGKTAIVTGAVLFAMLFGYRKYIVSVATTDTAALKILNSVIHLLETNERIKEDFPEVCFPIEKLEGLPQRAKGQLYQGKKTNMKFKTTLLSLPEIPGSAASGIRLETYGITSKGIRGTHYINKKGNWVRPDFVILDDPQDDESAAAPLQCAKREKIIKGTILGLAGPGKKISGFMPCTVIEKNDLTARILDHKKNPKWQGMTMKMLYAFPKALKTLWAQYEIIYNEGFENSDEGAAANKFYSENREAMDEGAVVAWESRKEPDEISAVQSAMNLFFQSPAIFYAEYQNNPDDAKPSLYNLTAEIVCSRVNHFSRFVVPDAANFILLFADVNQIGLNYTAAAFDNNFTGWIYDYGKYPEGAKNPLWEAGKSATTTESQAIAAGIMALVRLVMKGKNYTHKGRRIYPTIILDGNYMTETVHAAVFAANKIYPGKVIVDRGRGIKAYAPAKKDVIIGQAGQNLHYEKGRYGKQIVHNSDYWRMTTQKAFLLDVGVPGSLSIYGDTPRAHEDFANEICAEKLLDFAVGDRRDFFDWYNVPGYPNDKLDSTVGCCVGASFLGAKLTGGEKSWRPRRRKRRETRKPKVSMAR